MSNCNCIEKVVAAMKAEADRQNFMSRPNLGEMCESIAARLALSRAEEPWVEKVNPPRGPCTCNRNYVDDDEHAPDCGTQKPAPAPAAKFDAKAWAENMVPDGEPGTGCNGRGVIRAYDFPGDDYHWNPYGERESSTPYARRYIAAALTAAEQSGYERGKAEQKPRRWPEGRPTGTYARVMRWNQKYNCWDMVRQEDIENGAWWLPQPAPADAAKEQV